jgi:5-methylcytosine-specific restriction enzyme A
LRSEYKTKEQKKKFYNSKEWKQLRNSILIEQNFECQKCKELGYVKLNDPDKHKTFDVDHIKEISEFPDLALEPSNMRVLCIRHHNEKHGRIFERKKNEWEYDEKW